MEDTLNEIKQPRVVDIKRATLADNVRIYRVLKDAIGEEMSIPLPPVGEAEYIAWVVDTITTGMVFIAEYGGRVIGSFGMRQSLIPWAQSGTGMILDTAWLYVHPKYRSTGATDALVKKATDFAKAAKLPISFNASLQHNVAIREKLANIKCLQSIGEVFVYQPTIE